MSKDYFGSCAKCNVKPKICMQADGKYPQFCSTKLYSKVIKKAMDELKKDDIKLFAKMASIQEAECYIHRDKKSDYKFPTKPRIQEIIEFAKKMKYSRIGLAFCGGLLKEAGIVSKVLENNGFEVISVICKVGGIEKKYLGLNNQQKVKIDSEYESFCNPIAQAMILNEANTDFNIMLGLCVGHDSLFLRYINSMTTIFAVKDRLFGHNPLVAIYLSHSYYNRYLSPDYKF
jgi:uncharacterized metal-binding protein